MNRLALWRLWIDTGGTFTDAVALTPAGEWLQAKVLSSSALRGRVIGHLADGLTLDLPYDLPPDFFVGYRLQPLFGAHAQVGPQGIPIDGSAGSRGRIEVHAPSLPAIDVGQAVEMISPEEAPVLAARILCRRALGQSLPGMEMRLATTRGTNALLERKGERTALFVTRGHRDLLRIGTQERPELFSLRVERPAPLYEQVVEVDERLRADGSVLRPLDLGPLLDCSKGLLQRGFRSAAVALLHSFRNGEHERAVGDLLRQQGFEYVSESAVMSPTIKIVPRAETAVVDAYLSPVIQSYLAAVEGALGPSTLRVMTSAGGLSRSVSYRAKDSLLSGPAGGVVGAARAGRAAGFDRVLGFDMGGTSTDVCRYDGDYEYRFEHRVGDAHIVGPALAIETVAAGGGSVCSFDGHRLRVGPESAGAVPGPACYGRGGPLTLTDVNLLLGRIDPGCFEIPIEVDAAARAFDELKAEVEGKGEPLAAEAILAGFLDIANERMGEVIRRISVNRGYDPREYVLVAFGGAGPQHACSVAGVIGSSTILIPTDASLLSAVGLGAAVLERFAEQQVLEPLESLLERRGQLERWIARLEREACQRLEEEGVSPAEIEIRRRMVFLRLAGQDTALEIEYTAPEDLSTCFEEEYRKVYGYRPEGRSIEVESLRVVGSSRPTVGAEMDRPSGLAAGADTTSSAAAFFEGQWCQVPVRRRETLTETALHGPALVTEPHSVTVIEPGWTLSARPGLGLVLTRGSHA